MSLSLGVVHNLRDEAIAKVDFVTERPAIGCLACVEPLSGVVHDFRLRSQSATMVRPRSWKQLGWIQTCRRYDAIYHGPYWQALTWLAELATWKSTAFMAANRVFGPSYTA
jgi:hypothetical protein